MGQARGPILLDETEVFANGQLRLGIGGIGGELCLGLLVRVEQFLSVVDLGHTGRNNPHRSGIVDFAGRGGRQGQQTAGNFVIARGDRLFGNRQQRLDQFLACSSRQRVALFQERFQISHAFLGRVDDELLALLSDDLQRKCRTSAGSGERAGFT